MLQKTFRFVHNPRIFASLFSDNVVMSLTRQNVDSSEKINHSKMFSLPKPAEFPSNYYDCQDAMSEVLQLRLPLMQMLIKNMPYCYHLSVLLMSGYTQYFQLTSKNSLIFPLYMSFVDLFIMRWFLVELIRKYMLYFSNGFILHKLQHTKRLL